MSESIFTRARDRVSRAAERAAEAREQPAQIVEQQVEPAPVTRATRAEKPKRATRRAEVIDVPRPSARALRLPRLTSIGSLAKLAAAGFIWWWGLGNTQGFLSELFAPAEVGLIWAAGAQALLTALESDFWGGRRGSRIAQLALAADTLTNVVGVWVYIPNLPQMRIYQIISANVVSLPATLEGGPRFAVAAVAGVLIAWAPEALWKSASN